MTVARLQLALVQAAAALDPEANRAALARLVAEHAADADLVAFPEAFARDFGEAGSDLAAFAEPTDGPFGTTLATAFRAHACTVMQ